MSWFAYTAVAPDLAGDLVTGWTARIEGRHELVPDGCVDVLWIAGGRAVVCGPETAAWSFHLPPGTEAAGVRFRPGRAGPVLGFHTDEVRDRRVPLDDVLGSRRSRQLVQQLEEETPRRRSLVLQAHARNWLDAAPLEDPVAHAVVRMLDRDPACTVADMAQALGFGERRLHRRCRSVFGYGPATLRRILRLQRFLRLARQPGAPVHLAAVAAMAGYSDQQHLAHDCRAIAGTSPRVLIGRDLP